MTSEYYSNYQSPSKRPHKFWKFIKVLFFIIIILIVFFAVFSHKIVTGQDSVLKSIGRLPVIKQFRQVFGLENLKGELDDRINFLLLGQGGVGHEGPYLTDTIIFASLQPSTGKVAMFSIPRDLFVQTPGNGWTRINAVNSIGETKDYNGGGSKYLAETVEEFFGQPIHYWLRVDFTAFEKIINDLGGVEVCVDRSFEDQHYPTDDFKVQTISFEAGCQTMRGEQALQFSRSRHGTNNENSDFARSARQQKIILAIKDKVLNLGTLASPQKVYSILKNLAEHVQTNISWAEIPHLVKLAQEINSENVNRIVLDNTPSGLLRNGMTEDGAFILKPRIGLGNYDEIQNLAQFIFLMRDQALGPVDIVVLNGTEINGWARDIAGYLEQLNFNVLNMANVEEHAFEKTVIYKLNPEANGDALTILKKSLGANVSKYIPEFLNADEVENFDQADYLIVLGCKEDGECWIEDEIYKELSESQPVPNE